MKTARPAPTDPTEDRPECQEATDKMHPRTSPNPGTNKKRTNEDIQEQNLINLQEQEERLIASGVRRSVRIKERNDSKSFLGYLTDLGSSLLSWKSQKQPLVALSTRKAKSICEGTKELKWFMKFFSEIAQQSCVEIPLFLKIDSKSAIDIDRVECINVEEKNNYPTEFLNSLTPRGITPPRLNLKVGAIVMLLRNLNPKKGLCNDTGMAIQRMCSHVLEAQILSGTKV
ncbi:hypothetical protein LAZ67_X001641 [Cordylochernes scorpioides]|uniref:DNA helicase Pif1-like 2B domain-containing protein n=1 Tax=Cordylochernes scorpioides TaxID=51811 RepID=A0ABY6LV97_9ARAC|nr:hypothetical protein LAZ67_X001641 [Cordylochernes scorpioides]